LGKISYIAARMSEDEPKRLGRPQKKSTPMTTIMWIIIGLMLVLIAAWTVWAGRQPDVHSMWAPD
jgi:hypothetical protein